MFKCPWCEEQCYICSSCDYEDTRLFYRCPKCNREEIATRNIYNERTEVLNKFIDKLSRSLI